MKPQTRHDQPSNIPTFWVANKGLASVSPTSQSIRDPEWSRSIATAKKIKRKVMGIYKVPQNLSGVSVFSCLKEKEVNMDTEKPASCKGRHWGMNLQGIEMK